MTATLSSSNILVLLTLRLGWLSKLDCTAKVVYATIAATRMRDGGRGRGDLPDIVCACATLRRAARLVTQLYDEELRLHLPASQFALLSAIESRPGCNQSMLARMLAFDKTTL